MKTSRKGLEQCSTLGFDGMVVRRDWWHGPVNIQRLIGRCLGISDRLRHAEHHITENFRTQTMKAGFLGRSGSGSVLSPAPRGKNMLVKQRLRQGMQLGVSTVSGSNRKWP